MPMVPCPECKVPTFRRRKPKAGARRCKCDGCRAKHLQRAQLVTCKRPDCDNEITLPPPQRRSAKSRVCDDCQAKEAVDNATVGCPDCGEPWLRLTKGRGTARQMRCVDCRRASGMDATTLYECPVCEKPCNLEVKNGNAMYVQCEQCEHEESSAVMGGDLVALARSLPFEIPCKGRLVEWARGELLAGRLTQAELDVLDAQAEELIQRHMHVTDAEKLQLADDYDRAMRYPGHCCAVCGSRDATARYDRIYFDLDDPSLVPEPGTTRRLKVKAAVSARDWFVIENGPKVKAARPSAGVDRWKQMLDEQWRDITPAAAVVFDKRAADDVLRYERERATCHVRTQALPDWLHVPEEDIQRLESLQCGVFIEHDDDEGEYRRVDITALDLRHVMRVGATSSDYFFLVEEAVSEVAIDDSQATRVATMFVCGHCMVGGPRSRKLKPGSPPELSLAERDRARRYLSPRAVERLHRLHSLPVACRGLNQRHWRLPIASVLERTMLATHYLHVMSLKVAEEGSAAGGGSSSDCGRSHARVSKHTMYFPITLADARDRARDCEPWDDKYDAVDALRIAVEQVPLVFVGPDSKFDRLKQAALSMRQMQVRAEVVYTLITLGHLRRVEKCLKELRAVSVRLDKPGADVVDLRSRAVSYGVDDAALERELRARDRSTITHADVLKRAVNVAIRKLPSVLHGADDSLTATLDEALDKESPGGVSRTVESCIAKDKSNVFCRAAGGDAAREASDREVSDVAKVRGDRGRAPRGTEDDEAEPTAGCLDASNTAADVIFGCARLLRRGAEALDDYRSQSTCLYGAYHDLFPTGEGLVEGKPLTREMYRHLMTFYDGRFAQDLSLVFNMADTITRHAVNRAVFVRAKKSPGSVAKIERLMADPRTHDRLLEACQNSRGAVAVQLLHDIMPFVNMSAEATPYTDASRGAFKGTLFGYNRWLGPACRASPHRCSRDAAVLTVSCAQISLLRLRMTCAT